MTTMPPREVRLPRRRRRFVLRARARREGVRVAATAALREMQEHHRHAVELNPQIPWTADGEGRILEAGPRWRELTGLPAAQALGTGWLEALHPDDLPLVAARWGVALTTGEKVEIEYRLRHRDGSYRWMRATAGARRDAAGRIVRWYGMLEDIHERKRVEEALRTNEEFARSILENASDCIEVLDLDGTIRFVNGPGAALIGEDAATLLGRDWPSLWPPAHRPAAQAALAAARSGRQGRFLAPFHARSGRETWREVIASPIGGADGQTVRLLVGSRDMTQAMAARAAADDAHARLAAVLENTADHVLSVDRAWRLTYLNPRAERLLGDRLSVGEPLWDGFPDLVGGPLYQTLHRAMEGEAAAVPEAFLLSIGLWAELQVQPTPEGVTLYFRDITQARRAREAIRHLALHDPLTGLANRNQFNEALRQALARAERDCFAVLLLDLDAFKEVNDDLGHPVGDALLVRIAERFRDAVDGAGLLARLGGDEFAVLQALSARAPSPEALARRLIASLAEPIDIDGNVIRVGVSIGIAATDCEPREAGEIFRRADIALYQAKADGRGTFRRYEADMHAGFVARQALKQDLALAVEREQLVLVYQPILDLCAGRVCGYEALLRWHHPSRGIIMPAEFIPIAEETGLIGPIGDWILSRACRDAAGLPDGVGVSVNLSPVQFHSASLPMRIAKAVAEAGLDPRRLELEITESVLLNNSDANLSLLRSVKTLGARIALDDFGVGFSSLSYLRDFPFDKIKIDRSFVADIGTANHSQAIIGAVVALGRRLGMTITAEGVETEAQLRWLEDQGCHQAQGYLIGRPLPLPGTAAAQRA